MTIGMTLHQRWMQQRDHETALAGVDAPHSTPVDPEVLVAYNCGKSRQSSEVGMGSVSIRIDEALVAAARASAKAEFRTVQGQVEFWAKVGRAALDNPDLPASFIAESLISLGESRDDSAPFVPRSVRRA